MQEENVIISIQSRQSLETGEETMEQQARGLLLREGEGWTLTYREGEDSGLGSTRTTLRIEGERVILTRAGETTSQMVFQVGNPHVSLYETPYGKLSMAIRTLSLESGLTDDGGQVEIHYHIRLGGGPAGETRLRIRVWKKENRHDQ